MSILGVTNDTQMFASRMMELQELTNCKELFSLLWNCGCSNPSGWQCFHFNQMALKECGGQSSSHDIFLNRQSLHQLHESQLPGRGLEMSCQQMWVEALTKMWTFGAKKPLTLVVKATCVFCFRNAYKSLQFECNKQRIAAKNNAKLTQWLNDSKSFWPQHWLSPRVSSTLAMSAQQSNNSKSHSLHQQRDQTPLTHAFHSWQSHRTCKLMHCLTVVFTWLKNIVLQLLSKQVSGFQNSWVFEEHHLHSESITEDFPAKKFQNCPFCFSQKHCASTWDTGNNKKCCFWETLDSHKIPNKKSFRRLALESTQESRKNFETQQRCGKNCCKWKGIIST